MDRLSDCVHLISFERRSPLFLSSLDHSWSGRGYVKIDRHWVIDTSDLCKGPFILYIPAVASIDRSPDPLPSVDAWDIQLEQTSMLQLDVLNANQRGH